MDPLQKGAPRDLVWGKSYYVFEELERMHGPGAMAKYFRTKRRVLAEAFSREAATGRLGPDRDPDELARYVMTLMMGMAVMARGGAARLDAGQARAPRRRGRRA